MIKTIVLTVIALGISVRGQSFNSYKLVKIDTIYSFTDVDDSPEPEMGMPDLYKKWSSNARYPAAARRNGVEGRVIIYFIVDETGVIQESGIQEGIGHGCDEVTLEAFRKAKVKWKPGIKDGKKVKVRMTMPFIFKLG